MTKRIKLVEGIVAKAMENDKKVFKATSYTCDVENNILCLTHYNTLILRYNLISREVEDMGGAYSSSDRDAMNTALDYIGHKPTERFFIKNRELQFN